MYKRFLRFGFIELSFLVRFIFRNQNRMIKNPQKLIKLFSLVVIFLFLSKGIIASGGMGGGGGPIPQGKDRERFHLGKAVYNREIELSPVDPTKEIVQAERLEYLQGSLPNSEKKRVSLPGLAGKLSDLQLDSLEYFLSVRFNVKLEKK